MTPDDALSDVLKQLCAELPLDGHTIQATDVLRDLPGADSIRLFRMSAKLERQFGIEFEDERLFSIRTVGDLADLLVEATE
ncbi:acyl carrier protein [Lentzea sp. E54]|uniref:acyl carrier protein n=1 Tax=Lentzea xerophila TaxID=3435883 RepID=UPI003DA1D930